MADLPWRLLGPPLQSALQDQRLEYQLAEPGMGLSDQYGHGGRRSSLGVTARSQRRPLLHDPGPCVGRGRAHRPRNLAPLMAIEGRRTYRQSWRRYLWKLAVLRDSGLLSGGLGPEGRPRTMEEA